MLIQRKAEVLKVFLVLRVNKVYVIKRANININKIINNNIYSIKCKHYVRQSSVYFLNMLSIDNTIKDLATNFTRYIKVREQTRENKKRDIIL